MAKDKEEKIEVKQAATVLLKFKGLKYFGFEVDGKTEIVVSSGELVEVSAAKARQLLSDFPADWEK